MFSIKFTDAAAILASAGSAVSIAEAHGCLCGALCASGHYTFARWIDELADDSAETDAAQSAIAKDAMQAIYNETVQAFRGDELEFTPMLPDDDAPLARRAEALAQWCQGFLYGLGSVAGAQRNLPTEVDEVIRDFTQIARASAGDTEPTDEDESDYVEIVEYVRVGAQTIYDELHPTMQ